MNNEIALPIEQILTMYQHVKKAAKKLVYQDLDLTITMYRVGEVIRIDIKEDAKLK